MCLLPCFGITKLNTLNRITKNNHANISPRYGEADGMLLPTACFRMVLSGFYRQAFALARLAMAEAKTKSFNSRLSVCRISPLFPSHHLRPS